MKQIKNILKVAIMVVMATAIFSCSGGDRRAVPATSHRETEQVDEPKEQQVEKSRTQQSSSYKIEPKSSFFSFSTILIIISLLINVFVLYLLFGWKFQTKNSLVRHREDIEKLKVKLYQQKETPNTAKGLTEREVKQIMSSEKYVCHLIDRIRELQRYDMHERATESRVKATPINIEPQKRVVPKVELYSRTADIGSMSFTKVIERPETGVVYKITAQDNKASFCILESSYKKVLEAPEYLDGACDVQSSSGVRTRFVAIEDGVAEKQRDGKWKITKKAIVKFE